MPTALTGSMGWTGLHPLQLGGPPLVSTWSRPLPTVVAGPLGGEALPLVAHVYEADGVTPKGTFPVLNRPAIKANAANGGLEQVTLEVGNQSTSAVWGQFTWGTTTWGGKVIQGNVIKLTEDGGPWAGPIWGGFVESLPDTRSALGTKHEIVCTPFGAELTRVGVTTLVYQAGTDIAQAIRDAVALTQHCHCDQVSVPVSTGIPLVSTSGATVDFRGQKVNSVLDTCRSIAGPTWYWFCDENGRVWFQPQGSGAVYTLLGGQHYEERVSNGGDIQDRVNQVLAVGGVPAGGSANVQATYNGASQASIGVRSLDPPVSYPGITDATIIQALANGIGAALDQTWTRVSWKVLPAQGRANEKHPGRIHQSQPGGAMIRYFEETKNPLPESGQGTGYVGPFVCQVIEYDGLIQTIEAGNVPVTSQTDISNMVATWAQRASAIQLINTAASLNLPQTLTGSFQSPGGALVNGLPAGVWVLDGNKLALYDPSGIRRVAMGNLPANGVSPAGFKFEADGPDGSPLFDSFGLIAVMNALLNNVTASTQSLSPTFLGTPVTVTWDTSNSFTVSRQVKVLIVAVFAGVVNMTSGTTAGYTITLGVDGTLPDVFLSNAAEWEAVTTGAQPITNGLCIELTTVAAGTHTVNAFAQLASVGGSPVSVFVVTGNLYVFQLGG